MIFDITNKIIIVTGGNSGIGLEISKNLIKFGALVIRLDKKFKSETFNVIQKNISNLDIEIDLSDTKKIPKLLKNIKKKFKRIDGLINCHGTLPYGPMEYITRQAQGDYVILDQRDEMLWMDAGMVTTQADWSLDFDIGMNFFEWHAPVPLAHEMGIFKRALKFLLNVKQSAPARRLNWTMTVNPLLDSSPENYDKWGIQKTTLTPENIGSKQHLRVELQTFFRLPRSNALVFPIRCYLISFQDLVTIPKWGRRLHRVVRDLPVELATYKGFIDNRPLMLEYLEKFDDGLSTSPGVWPDRDTEPPLKNQK